ncbi:MAG TPA: protein kinase [Trebonia sp.]|jgi:serine/threonine-protein kinase|nr:protein kinase [Trebonia sp.]
MPEWRVPGYTELKGLGSGGFGEVVLARHDASGTLVAIKYLRRDLLAETEFAEMFRSEATVLASLDDPHVVRLYEYVESSSGSAIVMELVAGVSLREVLTFQGKTTAEAALAVLQGSLAGLATAHRRGVVHRDYKPENVLVNGDGISKLTDFGIAARAGSSPVPAGTLAYAAPEQMAGAPASPASDIYAATATFYECLTGRPPFTGEPDDLLRQHRSEPVPLDPVPAPLRPLVAAGMAKDAAERPTDATSFVAQLTAVATSAYGRHWPERGRSHLGEAALLLAALWPSGAPPAVQGTTVHKIPLRRRLKGPHIGSARAVIATGAAIAVVVGAAALATTVANRPGRVNHPVAAVQPISLRPASTLISPSQSLTQTPASRPLSSLSPGRGPGGAVVPASATDRTQRPQKKLPPAAPSNVTVTAIDPHDIKLNWQDNSGDDTGIEINNGVVSRDTGPDSTSYTWGGLASGTYMCFKIRTYNGVGDSPWEPDVSPWYRCTTTPEPPSSGTSSAVTVSSTTGWQKTQVSLKPGTEFNVTYVSGSWSVDYRNFPYVGPGGYSEQEDAKIYQGCKTDTSETYGVLLGTIGTAPGAAFPIGQGGAFSAGNGGNLYLRINDNDTCLGDNRGSVTMTITTK